MTAISLTAVGIAIFLAGVALVYVPAAVILAGICLAGFGMFALDLGDES